MGRPGNQVPPNWKRGVDAVEVKQSLGRLVFQHGQDGVNALPSLLTQGRVAGFVAVVLDLRFACRIFLGIITLRFALWLRLNRLIFRRISLLCWFFRQRRLSPRFRGCYVGLPLFGLGEDRDEKPTRVVIVGEYPAAPVERHFVGGLVREERRPRLGVLHVLFAELIKLIQGHPPVASAHLPCSHAGPALQPRQFTGDVKELKAALAPSKNLSNDGLVLDGVQRASGVDHSAANLQQSSSPGCDSEL
mmetsp:Transcript_4937/g.12926  ORF Transcript_4937/g.12926 Transcript_4937/m.12926 type:complete len:247 (+) Transcript_4937:783-1523(+)